MPSRKIGLSDFLDRKLKSVEVAQAQTGRCALVKV